MSDSRLHHPTLMPHLLLEGLNRYDEQPCLYLGDRVATYADVRNATSCMVQALQSRGLGVGSRVAVISGNRPEVLSNIAAMQLAGCCGTPLHPMGSLEDHVYVLEDANIDALVYDSSLFEQRAAELKQRVPGLKHLLALGSTEVGDDYLALAATFTPQALVAADVSPGDVCSLSYTGGTTGKPKGVLQTYAATAYLTMIQQAEWEFPQDLRMLIATPLSHAAAAFFIPVLQRGGAFYVMQGFSPDEFFGMIEQHRITATMLVPVMLYYLLDSPLAATADMSSMQSIFYGAAPMNPVRLREGIEKWGQVFYQFYGQNEAIMTLANMRRAEHDLSKPERLMSCGRPTPWMHVELLDDDNQPVPRGEPGEICVRGPLVMQGYNNLPEQTAEVFAGGWLHTGDIGRLDDEGFLYIVDRKKDMVVTGGFNVFPREVEDVIANHPAVAQVAVVGVPDERWGEAVKAVIVLKPGFTASAQISDDIVAMVKQAKGSVQAPKSVDFEPAIPMTAVGKPDKKAIKAKFWQGQQRSV
jgi:fatty-acyl-CoA synthase